MHVFLESITRNNPRFQPITRVSHITPSERTRHSIFKLQAPRSISYSSLPNSRVVSRTNSRTDGVHPPPDRDVTRRWSIDPAEQRGNLVVTSRTRDSKPQFRNAFEYDNPDQHEKEREYLELVERRKHKDSRFEEWNPIQWLMDSPRGTPIKEHPPFELGAGLEGEERERRPKLTLAHALSLGPQSDEPA